MGRGPGGEINEQGPSETENEKGGDTSDGINRNYRNRPSEISGLVGKFGRRLFPVQCRMLFMKLRAHVPLCRLVRARETLLLSFILHTNFLNNSSCPAFSFSRVLLSSPLWPYQVCLFRLTRKVGCVYSGWYDFFQTNNTNSHLFT